jgi:GTP diphosphokinase / guanosine-3',5'-bis(diphosphate) 3'-diphosphatase
VAAELDVGLFLPALRFSADAHRDQRRKDVSHSPYINHPIQVTELLWTVGRVRDPDTLIAALLHDTVEDTGIKPADIRQRFGERVLGLVLEVSDDKSLPKETRKRLQVETAARKSPGARSIKLADKICNLRDLIQSPPADWSLDRRQEYLLWTEEVFTGLRGTNPALERLYDEELANGKRELGLA